MPVSFHLLLLAIYINSLFTMGRMFEQLYPIGHSFFLLLVIMGPLTGLPVFLKITHGFDASRRLQSANRAIRFSLFLLLAFLFLGEPLLRLFGVSFESFKIAGGVVLLLLGIAYMFHIEYHKDRGYETDILVPFAIPLIVGPGVITTIILVVHWYGYAVALVSGLLALGVYWLFLRFSTRIVKLIGAQGIEVITRIMGLLLMAIAIEMIKGGVAGYLG